MSKKQASKVQIAKYSPYRPVNWRYLRIMELLSNTGRKSVPIKDVDDNRTIVAYKFIKKWEQISRSTSPELQEDALAQIFVDNPALYYAYDIYLKPADDFCKAVIEARLLARQTSEQIAQLLCLASPEVVDWYESLFFNIRDRIDSVDYISQHVIGKVVASGVENFGLEVSSKFFGYFAGPTMLDFVLNGVDNTALMPQPGQNIDSYADTFFNSIIRSRSISTAVSMKLDTYKIMPLLELHTKLIEEHNKIMASSGPKSQLEEIVSTLLTAIPWSVGQNRDMMLSESPLKEYIGTTVEPRADDLLTITTGESVEILDLLKDAEFPQPPIKENNEDETNN